MPVAEIHCRLLKVLQFPGSGGLLENPYNVLGWVSDRKLLEDVVHEIFEVLAKAEIELAWPDARAYLETFYSELIPPTAGHESSMLQDLRAGKRTEIDALCGAVERLGAAHGVATPVTSALAVLVRAAESDSEGESVA